MDYKYTHSQMIASADLNYSLKPGIHTIEVVFINKSDVNSVLAQLGSSVFHSTHDLSVHFEHLTGNDLLPVIDVYLNLEDEHFPDEANYIGALALYGLGESSVHAGGQNRVFDAETAFRHAIQQPNWSEKQFRLTLIPASPLNKNAVLQIGRITLYSHLKSTGSHTSIFN